MKPSELRHPVLVYGAAGHTARFVVRSLREQGHAVLLAGRDEDRLMAAFPGLPADMYRVVELGDAAHLERVVSEAAVVVNCAGPFADTTAPLLEAAVKRKVHYIDIAAEQAVAHEVFSHWHEPARAAGICVLPALGFFGGLGNLLTTVAMGEWQDAEAVELHFALDSWQPTAGTRKTGQRNAGRHLAYRDGRLQPPPAEAPRKRWRFAAPFGEQPVQGLSVADAVTIPQHLHVRHVCAWMNETPLSHLRSADTPAPHAVDPVGRSAQRFLLEVVVRRNHVERRCTASGQDIYAVTGPLVAEAVTQLMASHGQHQGAFSAGAIFNAREFLQTLSPMHLALDLGPSLFGR